MLFLTINNIDIDFQVWDLQWRFYITRDVLTTNIQVELIGKKEFATVVLDQEHKVFIVYIAAVSVDSGDKVHPSKRA